MMHFSEKMNWEQLGSHFSTKLFKYSFPNPDVKCKTKSHANLRYTTCLASFIIFNTHDKIMHIQLGENECIFHKCKVVIWVQITNSMHPISNFCLSWLPVMLFSCTLFTSNNIISLAICCKWAFVNFWKTTNCTPPTGSCNSVVFENFTSAY